MPIARGRPRAGQVERRRERGAVGQPRLGGDDVRQCRTGTGARPRGSRAAGGRAGRARHASSAAVDPGVSGSLLLRGRRPDQRRRRRPVPSSPGGRPPPGTRTPCSTTPPADPWSASRDRSGCSAPPAASRRGRAPGRPSRPEAPSPAVPVPAPRGRPGPSSAAAPASGRRSAPCCARDLRGEVVDVRALLEVGAHRGRVGDREQRDHREQHQRPAGQPRPGRGDRAAAACAPRRPARRVGGCRGVRPGPAYDGVPARSAPVPRERGPPGVAGGVAEVGPRCGAAGCTSRPARSAPGRRS